MVTTTSTSDDDPSTDTVAHAMCRPDEQLTGGACEAGHMGRSEWGLDANGVALLSDSHTFGGGWFCQGKTSEVKAQAFCLADAGPPQGL